MTRSGGRSPAIRRLPRAAAFLLLLGATGTSALPGAAQQGPRALDIATSPRIELLYWPAQERLARQLAAVAARFGPLPGIPADALADSVPTRVFLAPDAARFDSLTGGLAPPWAGGIAAPGERRIVLPAYPSERGDVSALAVTLHHELAHVALHRYLRDAPIPRWFDEGYAQLAAGQWDIASAWQVRVAFALHQAPPLDSLELSFPRPEAPARLAYLLAATAVQYLVDSSGPVALSHFLARWREEGRLEPAMRGTYGVTLGQFEEDWRSFVKRRYGWAFFVSQAVIFWFFASIGLVLLWLRRRRLDRARMARLREAEPPDEPAFWLEPPAEPRGPSDREEPGSGPAGPPPA